MADHPHAIDRWDDATGENLVVEIRGRGVWVLLLSAKHLVLAAMQPSTWHERAMSKAT